MFLIAISNFALLVTGSFGVKCQHLVPTADDNICRQTTASFVIVQMKRTLKNVKSPLKTTQQ